MLTLSESDILNAEREACKRSLAFYTKLAWNVIEPTQKYVHGWHIDVICEHLEAVTRGEILRLFVAIPPGMMKSLLIGCFWPSWEWGPAGLASYRYLGAAHSASLSIRDNVRMRRLIQSEWYQKRWGEEVRLLDDQNAKTKFENTQTGFREAMAFTGLTGNRGDRLLMDDVLSVDDAISDTKRTNAQTTFLESVPTRLNSPSKSAIVIIQQRLHEDDIIGTCVSRELGYEGLVLPMEYEADNPCTTKIGFKDPRKKEGELLFPARFPRDTVDALKRSLGSIATASQLQQRPMPREGGMFNRADFEVLEQVPSHVTVKWIRGWDLAATDAKRKGSSHSSPAYTAGVRIGLGSDKVYYISNVIRGQLSPGKVETMLKTTANHDGVSTTIDLPQDPGQAGKAQIRTLVILLAGYNVVYGLESGSKELRASAFAAQVEIGNVKLIRGAWNEAFLAEAEAFPMGRHKDQIDAASRGFSRLTVNRGQQSFAGPIVLARG
jgi:predicted phage terminase large subunit-like protein